MKSLAYAVVIVALLTCASFAPISGDVAEYFLAAALLVGVALLLRDER